MRRRKRRRRRKRGGGEQVIAVAVVDLATSLWTLESCFFMKLC